MCKSRCRMSSLILIAAAQVCKRHLFSDVKEMSPRSAEQLQSELSFNAQMANKANLGASAMSNKLVPGSLGDISNTTTSSSNVVDPGSDRQGEKGKWSESSTTGASISSTAKEQTTPSINPSGINRIEDDNQRLNDTRLGIELMRRYIYPCFKCSKYGAKAKPFEISNILSDAELFATLRESYFAERTYFWRFLELREVKQIHYVQVRMYSFLLRPYTTLILMFTV